MIRIKTLFIRHRRMSMTHFIKIDFLHMIQNLSNQFNSMIQMLSMCQNDDFETIKKRKTLFRRRQFDILIKFI